MYVKRYIGETIQIAPFDDCLAVENNIYGAAEDSNRGHFDCLTLSYLTDFFDPIPTYSFYSFHYHIWSAVMDGCSTNSIPGVNTLLTS